MTHKFEVVVLVRGEPTSTAALRSSLDGLGYPVLEVARTHDAVAEVISQATPRVVILDLVDRTTTDGIATAIALKERLDTPFILVVPSLDPRTVEAIKEAEPIGLLSPPVLAEALLVAIELGTHRHATERRLRERRRETERLASLGTMVAGLVHEISNPLTFMLASTEAARQLVVLLRARADLESQRSLDQLQGFLEEVTFGSDRVRRLVDDLKVLSRPSEVPADGAPCVVVLEQSIAWALSMARRELRGRGDVVTLLEKGILVAADETRLGQLFLNLLLNAAHALDPANAHVNVVRVKTRMLNSNTAEVEIADTGSGMTDDVRNRMFDPFFTTKRHAGGTGLGLPICQGIVAALGGEILVESIHGFGSTFRVHLPALEQREPD